MTKRIFCTALLIGMLAILAATGHAQAQPRDVRIPQDETLRVTAAADATQSLPAGVAALIGNPKYWTPQLKGAWNLTFTPYSGCVLPFASLATFSSEGVITNTAVGVTLDHGVLNDQNSLVNNQSLTACQPTGLPLPGSASPGIGVWARQQQEFALTFAHLLYDRSGQCIGVAKVRASLRIFKEAAHSLTGDYVTDVFDSGGNIVMVLKGQVAGQRLFVETMEAGQ